MPFGERRKMFWQEDSLAMESDRMKRMSLAYSVFTEEVSHVDTELRMMEFVQICIPSGPQ